MKLYSTARDEYAGWIAVVKDAIEKGDSLEKKPNYKKIANSATGKSTSFSAS